MVWGCNPYVKGIKDGKFNAGNHRWLGPHVPIDERYTHTQMMEVCHGLNPNDLDIPPFLRK